MTAPATTTSPGPDQSVRRGLPPLALLAVALLGAAGFTAPPPPGQVAADAAEVAVEPAPAAIPSRTPAIATGTALAAVVAAAAPPPIPAAGIPAAGISAAGISAAGISAAGISAAGTPAAGTPAAGTPAAGPPLLLRVGLASDLPQVDLPAGVVLETLSGERLDLAAPLRVTAAAGAVSQAVFRLQVAALKDEAQAHDLARRLAVTSGEPADAHFDAGTDLYKVQVGRWGARARAEAGQRRLQVLGIQGGWIVQVAGGLEEPALALATGQRRLRLAGRWLAARAAPIGGAGDRGVAIAGGRYRGRILVYLNERGSLNLINELPLEDYLRGVVPREMGPEEYSRLEALKAQAVAARTYTLRNLGEFTAEGYDICATPRCQVYGGMAAEHPLSDRAIGETARQVLLYDGQPVDALYSATCGGHTEDSRLVFPQKDHPYLAGVPCLESGGRPLQGALAAGTPFPDGLTRRLFPPPAGGDRQSALAVRLEALAVRLEALAAGAGLPPAPRSPGDDAIGLTSLQREAVRRYLRYRFDLALPAELLAASPAGGGGLLPGPAGETVGEAEAEQLLLALAETLGTLRRETAYCLSLAGSRLLVRRAADAAGAGGERRHVDLDRELSTFRLRGDRWVAGRLSLVPGDRLVLFWHGDRLVAVVQDVDLDTAAPLPVARLGSWTRFRSRDRLAERVATEYPGLAFAGFEVLERGVSGRVARILIQGGDGRSVEVAGLPVRWLLDLPDTLFSVAQSHGRDGRPGWLFDGRGWGHGVGLCQIGGYGMAGRGASYREILHHYYSGARLVRVRGRRDGPVS